MSVLAPGRNLVLAGMMGTGKSTVGRLLAERLGRALVDTDEVVARDLGVTIPEIFAERGERAFRAAEASVLRSVSAVRGQVVSVGGGALLEPQNVTCLRATGEIVVLDAPPEVLAARLGSDDVGTRPLLAGSGELVDRLAALREARDDAYRAAAVVLLDTAGKEPETVVEEILAWARTHPGVLARDERESV